MYSVSIIQIKQMDTIVLIKEKNVYGKIMLYPNNDVSNKLLKLLFKKTFTENDIKNIEDLGFQVTIQKL